jgi:hypothetical protein
MRRPNAADRLAVREAGYVQMLSGGRSPPNPASLSFVEILQSACRGPEVVRDEDREIRKSYLLASWSSATMLLPGLGRQPMSLPDQRARLP